MPLSPAVDEMHIILPLRLLSICGMYTLQVIQTPLRSTFTVSSHCSSVNSQLGAKEYRPAFATRISMEQISPSPRSPTPTMPPGSANLPFPREPGAPSARSRRQVTLTLRVASAHKARCCTGDRRHIPRGVRLHEQMRGHERAPYHAPRL